MIRKYPSLFLLGFVVIGILAADWTRLPGWLFFLGSLGGGIIGFFLWAQAKKTAASLLFAGCFFFLAAFHFAVKVYDTGPIHLSRIVEDGQRYHIFGTVSDWPRLKSNRTEFKISLDSLRGEVTQPVRGAILLKVNDLTTALQRGDRIEFEGRIYTVKKSNLPGKFDYQRYLYLKGIFGVVYLPTLLDVRVDKGNRYSLFTLVDKIRSAIRSSLSKNLSPEAAALASGFLIGETRNIPPDLYRLFRDTGTLHLLAVSGSNVALVIFTVLLLLKPFALPWRKKSLVLIGVIILFTLLAYEEPSVLRASLMAGLVILARSLQRRYDLNHIIATAALVILLVAPTQLFDIGFQLSFVTAWGLIYFTPQVTKLFPSASHRWWYRWLLFPFIITLIAQLCSAPLIALYFHRVPLISPIANLVIVPLVSLAVVGIIAVLAAHLLLPLLGAFVGSLVNVLLLFVIRLLNFFGEAHWAVLSVKTLSPWLAASFYLFYLLVTKSLFSKKWRRRTVLTALVGINAYFLASLLHPTPPPERVIVSVVPVAGGMVSVVQQGESPTGDVFFAGLHAKEYDLDEVLVSPLLHGLGITSLSSLFVISADYGVIDDILRIARQFHAKDIFINPALERSFDDVRRLYFSPSHNFPAIRLFPWKNLPISEQAGYYPFAHGVLADFGTTEALFLGDVPPPLGTALGKSRKPTVVCGLFSPQNRAAFNLPNCSKNAHLSDWLTVCFSPGALQPDTAYCLKEEGALRIEIDPSGMAPLKISPL